MESEIHAAVNLIEQRIETAKYAIAASEHIKGHSDKYALVQPYLTRVCPECNCSIAWADDPDHLTIQDPITDHQVVVIGCEGYWVINPNIIGIPSPNWMDWLADNGDNS